MPLLRAVARTLTAQNALARAASAAGAARRTPGGAPGGGAAGVLRAFAGASSAPQMTEEARQVLVKKLIYRSGMRGWLELDLILGKWAQDHLPGMPAEELTQYAVLLDEEVPDVFKWLTGQEEPPEHLASNAVYRRVKKYVDARVEVVDEAGTRTAGGKDWLRGWNDHNKYPGNQ